MKKFTVNCNFGGQMAPFTIYIGKPNEKNHPIQFQSKWLADNRGGNVPAEVMDGLTKIKDIATNNGVDFEELCTYALQAALVSNKEPDKVLQNQAADQPNPQIPAEESQQTPPEQAQEPTSEQPKDPSIS